MNKRQLIVMWFGIILFCLILVFPEWHSGNRNYPGYWKNSITRTKLCLIVPAVAGGLIVTFRNKDDESDDG